MELGSYYGARFYDSELGRFISVDPARDGGNWFVYCYQNPLKWIDPDGLRPGGPVSTWSGESAEWNFLNPFRKLASSWWENREVKRDNEGIQLTASHRATDTSYLSVDIANLDVKANYELSSTRQSLSLYGEFNIVEADLKPAISLPIPASEFNLNVQSSISGRVGAGLGRLELCRELVSGKWEHTVTFAPPYIGKGWGASLKFDLDKKW